ncbi:MAG TPA: DJ-1/PfpI family protein, partial [Fibrobacteraceae bacterium]|nr:DJ-1/PfpI family protein [Fibrobacteraceae bacterium]
MKMILFVLAEGFEELEFVAPFDILKRGGLEVVTATLGANLTVRSVRNLLISADLTLEQASQTSFDLVFLPGGGPGTRNLRKSPRVGELVRQQIASGREVAAICAAPLVLGDVGLLRDRKATCFPD